MTDEFWHFMFKMTSRHQIAFPEFEGAYADGTEARKRLFGDYQVSTCCTRLGSVPGHLH